MSNFKKCKAKNGNKNFENPTNSTICSYGLNTCTISSALINAGIFEIQS